MNFTLLGAWRHVLRQIGPLGLAALGCALTAIALALWIPPLQREEEVLRAELQAKVAAAARTEPTTATVPVSLAQQVDEFVTAFPPLSQNAEDFKQVFASAWRHGMRLPRGEYQFRNDSNAPLLTVTATFPVTADYASIKVFSAEVLKTLPHASLEELRMTRNAAGSPTLESSIRFAFVYRKS